MNAAGDYILLLALFGQTFEEDVTVKITVADGKGDADVDLSSFVGPAGEGFRIENPILYLPLAVPASCPGTNTAGDIALRQGDADCTAGPKVGVIGVASE